MSIELITIVLFGGLLLLLALGIPVSFALGGITVLLTFLFDGPDAVYTVATTTYQQMTSPTLMTIPLFLIMGNFLVESGISERMYNGLSYWLSGVRGGLAIVSIGVCVALAMCGGFGPGILTMGLVAVPAMLKHNYSKSIALGSVMAGGVLGEIIPPAIIMIIFAFIARISIGKLFFGGIVPGFILALLYICYIIFIGIIRPQDLPKPDITVSWGMRWKALGEIFMPCMLVVLVLGSIFIGAATPTEAAGVGALGSMIICAIHRKLTLRVIMDSCTQTLKITGMALWILIPATLFGVFYATAGAQDMIMELIESLEVNRYLVLICMQGILLIFGMFMDDYAVVTICAPIMLPIARMLGFDPIWFSILFILNMQMAYLTPPFGWALIMMKGVVPADVSTEDIWRSVPPFVLIQLFVLILVMIFPEIATWLPNIAF
ncbi:MAG: TRAP transporter large permease subunit [Proteobacteria bacterium]|nr:TRAP transporter large permease subunit [Pseudomonadota bacterium]MBU1584426.1 TRAP transporter large permease subunit [Pseudomonadota bacterium]MBU2453646.1 TRAP transporter large permease subunit [Pseudomonadota bacterium]MBU2630404.1 TRAP transporter large permease subunit [Pseudomonadota bacterium]